MGLLDKFRQSRPGDDGTPPPDRAPIGASGRAHTHGFLQLEEHNNELRHPQGHRIYDQMYRTDGDVRQVVAMVCNPITGGTWQVQPYGGEIATAQDQAVAEFVRWALWDFMRPGLPAHLAQALPVLVRSGFAPFEFPWASVDYKPRDVGDKSFTAGGRIVPRTLGLRLPRTIYQWEQDAYGQMTRIRQQLPISRNALVSVRGVETAFDPYGDMPSTDSPSLVWIEGESLVYYRVGGEGDNWEGVSMLRPAYKHWLMKDKIERIDAIAQEREGLGIPIAYPPLGATDEQLDAVEQVLDGMRTNDQGYIVSPGPKAGAGAPEGQGWLFDLIGYNRTGTGRDPQPSLKYHTDKIAAAFIAEFIRLGHMSSKGSGGGGSEVQVEPFMASVEALVGIVEDALNDSLVAPLVAYNFAGVENPPRLKMSLVDTTSLSQLADFVLKLVQVGALLPDQELEDFLRARADLPPADPDAVKGRKGQDQEIRREVVVGQGEPGGGGGAPKMSKPGFSGGNKPAPKRSPGSHGSGGVGSNGLDADSDETIILAVSERADLRPWEQGMCLDELEAQMDAMPDLMCDAAGQHVYAMARDGAPDVSVLCEAINGVLSDAYHFGASTAHREITGGGDATSLDRGARDRGAEHLAGRAQLAAERVAMEMRHASSGNDLASGNAAAAQAAAERAGMAALRRAGFDHGVPAIQHGRHDEAVTLAEAGAGIVGARYTAVLDSNTCGPCREADDGQLRALDDPVRLERQPPNPHCLSVASGFNRCRCIEQYEVA